MILNCNLNNNIIMNWIPTFLLAIPIIIGLYQWHTEQANKRRFELYIKKEKLYLEMQQNLWGFYGNSSDRNKRQKFIENVQVAWLYCPDSFITICNEFIDNGHVQQNQIGNDEVRLKIVNRLLAEMRKDLLSNKYVANTVLTSDDIRNVNTN
jgi:hypothetical protein